MRLGIHRVVKILGILAVDGHERQAAQVQPLRSLARINFLAVALRLAGRLGRKFARQIEARDGRFAGKLDGLFGVETSRDAGLGVGTLSAVAGNCGDDPVAVPSAAKIGRRNEATESNPPVGRGHEGGAPVNFESPDEGLGGMFEDGFQLPGVPSVTPALHAHAHPITVHDANHLRRRQDTDSS